MIFVSLFLLISCMHLFNFTSRIPYVGNYFTKDQGPRAPDIAEKLSQLTVGSNRVPSLASDKFVDMKARTHGNTMKRPLPPVGTRTWHAPADPFRRPYEMPGDRAFLPRKLVS